MTQRLSTLPLLLVAALLVVGAAVFSQRSEADPDLSSRKVLGVAVGIVTDNKDPQGGYWVRVKFPWLRKDEDSFWARIVSPAGGRDRGTVMLPQLGDEVVCAFEHGDVARPFVLGQIWNGQ